MNNNKRIQSVENREAQANTPGWTEQPPDICRKNTTDDCIYLLDASPKGLGGT